MENLQALDKQAITELVYAYCRAVDRLDIELGQGVFHKNSNALFGSFSGSGHGWIEFICEKHREYDQHSHQVTNVLISVKGDVAASESYVTATLIAGEAEGAVQYQFLARYIDRWSRKNGNWGIEKRECVVDSATSTRVRLLSTNQRSRRDKQDPSYLAFAFVRDINEISGRSSSPA